MLKGKTPSGKQLYQYLADTLKPVWGEEAETLSKYLLKEIFDFSLTDIVTSKSIDLNEKSGNQLKKIIEETPIVDTKVTKSIKKVVSKKEIKSILVKKDYY